MQALIMFLVFEKEVLTMDDDKKELDLYFLEKHRERMNYEIINYKEKMQMKYGLSVYRIKSDMTYYVAAENETQAILIANRNRINVDHIKLYDLDEPMMLNDSKVILRSLVKKIGIIGGNEYERHYTNRQLNEGY